jgi:putative ubiquitin-RnfH superfamily antitoxin RatB of RatAB toxin-antitoxin module
MLLSNVPSRFMASESGVNITVAYAPAARQVHEVALLVDTPCSVLQALQRSGLLQCYPEIDSRQTVVGVWGRKAELDQLLRAQDRVEIYRPLRVDPKVARRERFAKQGSRSAGLFDKKRAGAKAGY